MANYIYDLAQLIHQQKLAPVSIVAHSLGGNISLRYAGIYPENVHRLVAIEGLGPGPRSHAEADKKPIAERMRDWVDEQRAYSGRQPHRYASIEQALTRMQEANPHLSEEQARHLTQHGVNQNEDGTYSWKFDQYVRLWPSCGRASPARPCWSMATKAGRKTRKKTVGRPTSARLRSWVCRTPGIGSSMTSSTCSSRPCANSSPPPDRA
jgi:pimeloyl-ACP methyl ester carboxylesterase